MATKRFATVTDFTCTQQLVRPSELGDSAVVISAAVGDALPWRCPNLAHDVRTIQKALNRFRPLDGGPEPPLVPDGLCGPLTRKAIRRFQEKQDTEHKGKDVRDGIVDPGGPTIQLLRRGPSPATPPTEEFFRHLPRLTEVLTAARASLQLVRFHLKNLSGLGFGELAAARFERHFHGSQTPSALAQLEKVDRLFLDMQVAIGHVPQGVVLLADEPADIAVGSFMFTFEGGYHLRRPEHTFESIHVGSIYLCPKSRTLNGDAFVYALIHELAHYVGPTAPGIDDIAYFHKTPNQYRALSPTLALRNADSYSQYAYDAVGKPDFNLLLHRV